MALAIEPGVRIRGAGVGVIAARLPLPVRLRIAPATTRPLIVGAVLRPKALLARPRLNQRAVDREVLLGQQPTAIGQAQHLGKEAFHHLMRQQPVAILRERRVVPDRIIERHADEPAEQQVVAQLLAQLPLAADRVEHLQQQGANQLLRGDRVPAGVSVNLVEPACSSPPARRSPAPGSPAADDRPAQSRPASPP